MSFFDWLSVAAIALSILSIGWNAYHYLRHLKVIFHRTQCFQIDNHRYLLVFRFSIWNPSSQTKSFGGTGIGYDRRYALFGKWIELDFFEKKGDKDKFVWVDEKGKQVSESSRDEFYEYGLNIEPHHTQSTSLPILLDVSSADIMSSLLDEELPLWIYLYAPNDKRVAKCRVKESLRQLLSPVSYPLNGSSQ